MKDALAALDADWNVYVESARAAGALARWQLEDNRYQAYRDVADLRQAFERRDAVDVRERLLADLVGRSPHDSDARLVVLSALRPGLVRLASRLTPAFGWEEAASVVVAVAVQRLSAPGRRLTTDRVSATVLGDIWHAAWAHRRREHRRESRWGERMPLEVAEAIPAHEPDDPNELLCLLDEAVQRREIKARDARLVVLHRVLGYNNVEIAELVGFQPCTVRKRRRRAERTVAGLAVA